MRGVGGNLGVAPGRGNRLIGQRRHVVGVNDVVGQAGMVRLLSEELFEDLACLQATAVGFVTGVRGNRQGKRVEDGGLVILGIAARDLSHGIAIAQQAGWLGSMFEISVKGCDRSYVGAFPGALGV